MSLGEKITLLRKDKKWSQEALSKTIGVNVPLISKYENEKTLPSIETLKKIADVFEVTVDYLLYNNASRNGKSKLSDPEIIEELEKIEKLDDEDKKAIKRMIQAMIKNKELQEVMNR